ncbi:thiamine biosynthesis protein ThiF [Georgenia sp. 10Sc9-8]|uniref:Thiamine biosynthesis protein ThiF n=1 Tax=Georgenia halotolerans TaxID=3028317 RepID=A0ABT5TZI8_9MICO|nr:thiamine biosynthesis protein ThiF [Georgenia halotolerans]
MGVTPERVHELVELVRRAGVLHPAAKGRARWQTPTAGPDEAYWERLRQDGDGAGVLARRSAATVAVLGLDRLGLAIATQVAAAGVGTVLVEDECPALPADHPGGLRDRTRAEAARAALRRTVPEVRTSAPAGTRPDLLVMVSAHVTDPVRVRPLMREDVPHLPMVVGDVEVVVGPLVVPGTGPCTRCCDLHRTDADPAWPAVATQLRVMPCTGPESGAAALAAALVTHQVLAHLDGREVAVRGASLEVTALDPVPAVRPWSVHPACGCQAPAPALPPAAAPAGQPLPA